MFLDNMKNFLNLVLGLVTIQAHRHGYVFVVPLSRENLNVGKVPSNDHIMRPGLLLQPGNPGS